MRITLGITQKRTSLRDVTSELQWCTRVKVLDCFSIVPQHTAAFYLTVSHGFQPLYIYRYCSSTLTPILTLLHATDQANNNISTVNFPSNYPRCPRPRPMWEEDILYDSSSVHDEAQFRLEFTECLIFVWVCKRRNTRVIRTLGNYCGVLIFVYSPRG